MILKQKVSDIFIRNAESKERFVINRGGTRSTKTYSLLQLWIEKSFMMSRKNILVTRQTMPALRLSALRDFQEILFTQNIEDKFLYHKTHSYFENRQTKTKIYFIPCDREDKVHGVKWDFVQLNEGDQIHWNTVRQMLLRTEAQIFVDFNPSNPDSWVNIEIEQGRNDFELIQSSYLDNPFLNQTLIDEIEHLKGTDQTYWNIYGKGDYGVLKAKIYPRKKTISLKEYNEILGAEKFAGLDLGYVHPTAMIQFKYHNEKLYGHQIYYESYKDENHLIKQLEKQGISKTMPIYTDVNYPLYRKKLLSAGYNAKKAKKDSVIDSIKFVESLPIYVTRESEDYWRENRKYKFKEDAMGKVIEEPVKFDDDLMDAERYAIYSHLKNRIYRRFLKRG